MPQISISFEEYWCNSMWNSWLEVNPEDDGIEDLFYGLPAESRSPCLSLEKAHYTSWAAASTISPWSPIISPPCCDTYCDIKASSAQLYYWPTTPSAPNVTTMIGEGGFTL